MARFPMRPRAPSVSCLPSWVIFLVGCVGLVLVSVPAKACSCPHVSAREAWSGATFIYRVVLVRPHEDPPDSGADWYVARVEEVLKGRPAELVSVGFDHSMCPVNAPMVGSRTLVFAYHREVAYVSLCNHDVREGAADYEPTLRRLRQWRDVGPELSSPSRTCAACSAVGSPVGSLGGVLFSFSLAIVTLGACCRGGRRRRRSG